MAKQPKPGLIAIGLDKTLEEWKRIAAKATDPTALTRVMGYIGRYIIDSTHERSMLGLDYRGERFKEYSKRYAAFRREHGRSTDVVNLEFTGGMWGALRTAETPSSVKVFFLAQTATPLPKKAKAKKSKAKKKKEDKGRRTTEAAKAAFLNKTRPFFYFSEKQMKRIAEIYDDHLKELLGTNGDKQ